MRGNNELILNKATMIEAVQFWLDSKWKGTVPKVSDVSPSNSPSRASFTISVTERDETEKPV